MGSDISRQMLLRWTPMASPKLARNCSSISLERTLKDTFQDVNLTVENPNPVMADANGRFGSIFLATDQPISPIWTAPTVENPTGAEVWSVDPVGPAAGGAVFNVAGIIGEIRMFAGIASAVPSGWYLCYGQNVSRTTYSAAFSILGTSWGAGDGATTFGLPDLRGRGLFGLDNMGGMAAGRITIGRVRDSGRSRSVRPAAIRTRRSRC